MADRHLWVKTTINGIDTFKCECGKILRYKQIMKIKAKKRGR